MATIQYIKDQSEEVVLPVTHERGVVDSQGNNLETKLNNISPEKGYDSTNPNGMGYVILKENKTFAEQVTATNTIYEIRYAFALGDTSVTIPDACILKFEGGELKNGTIILNNCGIECCSPNKIFTGITFVGDCHSSTLSARNFGAKSDLTTNTVSWSVGGIGPISVQEYTGTDNSTVFDEIGSFLPHLHGIFTLDGDFFTADGYDFWATGCRDLCICGAGIIKMAINVSSSENIAFKNLHIVGRHKPHELPYIGKSNVNISELGFGSGMFIGRTSAKAPCNNVSIIGCTFEMVSNAIGSGSTTIAEDWKSSGIIVDGCKFYYIFWQGVGVHAKDVIVSNCVFDLLTQPIDISTGNNRAVVSNCIATRCCSPFKFTGTSTGETKGGCISNCYFEISEPYPSDQTYRIDIGNSGEFLLSNCSFAYSSDYVGQADTLLRVSNKANTNDSHLILTGCSFSALTADFPITNIIIPTQATPGRVSINNTEFNGFHLSGDATAFYFGNVSLKGVNINITGADYLFYCNIDHGILNVDSCRFVTSGRMMEYTRDIDEINISNSVFIGDKTGTMQVFMQATKCQIQGNFFDGIAIGRCSSLTGGVQKFCDNVVKLSGYSFADGSNQFVCSGDTYIERNIFLFDDVTITDYSGYGLLNVQKTATFRQNVIKVTPSANNTITAYITSFSNQSQAQPVVSGNIITGAQYPLLIDNGVSDNVTLAKIVDKQKGKMVWNSDNKTPAWWNGSGWFGALGVDMTGVSKVRGTSTERTGMSLSSANSGLIFYDTTLSKYVLWDGSNWVNMDGSALS